MDAYSRKIVGCALYSTLEAFGCILTLKMSLEIRKRKLPFALIHHSDKRIQYCCAEYLDLLNGNGIAISLTQSSSPHDNAMAERVNGIIKNEFFPRKFYQNHQHLQ
jgi:putative transposase